MSYCGRHMVRTCVCFQRWVWAFCDNKFHVNVNTTNSLERQNRNLKHKFLLTYRDSTLSGLVTVVVKKYLQSLVTKSVISIHFNTVQPNQSNWHTAALVKCCIAENRLVISVCAECRHHLVNQDAPFFFFLLFPFLVSFQHKIHRRHSFHV